MKLHRFYIEESPKLTLSDLFLSTSDTHLIHQWRNVLRFKEGDCAELFLKNGTVYLVKLSTLTKKIATWEILEMTKKDIQLSRTSLYMSVIKKDNFELTTQKVTELGVAEIIPITSTRSQTKPLNFDRLYKIATEATEQSGGIIPPVIGDSQNLEEALLRAKRLKQKIIVCEFDGLSLSEFQKGLNVSIALFIGPEGGWSEDDRELFEKHAVQKISFGEKVLRAETAAIVGVWEMNKK